MSNWLITRWKHVKAIGKTWWFLVPATWGIFWALDEAIEKWDLGIKTWWDAHTSHLPSHWEAWLIVLLLTLVVFLIEGSYRHVRDAAIAAKAEADALKGINVSLQEELRAERDRSRPNFSLRVSRFMALPGEQVRVAFGKNDIDSVAFTEVVIVNSGSPSAAFDWRCEAHRDGEKYDGWVFIHGTGAIQLGDDKGKIRLAITRSDFIQERLSNTPLSTGARNVGWVAATFTGLSKEQLYNPSTEIIVSCDDVLGKRWTLSYHPSGVSAERIGYEPGGVTPIN